MAECLKDMIMKYFKQVRRNVIDMLEDLDDQLNEIIQEGTQSDDAKSEDSEEKTNQPETNYLLDKTKKQ